MRSPRLRAPLLILLAVLLPAAAASAQATILPGPTLLDRYGLVRGWWNQATTNVTRDRIQYLVADEEMVFVQSSSGIITAFDAETGRQRWSSRLGRQDDPSFPAATNDRLVLVAIGVRLYALDKRTGNVQWELRIPKLPSASPAVDGRNVYVGCLDGSLYAFGLDRIRELYAQGRLPQWSYQAMRWEFQAQAAVSTPPLPVSLPLATGGTLETVNFADAKGSLYCLSAQARELRFQLETDAPASAPLTHSHGLLYMPSRDFDLYCIDLASGAVRWRFVSGNPITNKAAVIGDDLFVTPIAGGMFCLSAREGERKWWRPNLTEHLATTNRLVYASDEQGNVVILARNNGMLIGALPLRGFPIRVANDRTDRLYLASESGLVVCLRELQQNFPLFHMYPERRPILPEFAPVQPAEPPADGDQPET